MYLQYIHVPKQKLYLFLLTGILTNRFNIDQMRVQEMGVFFFFLFNLIYSDGKGRDQKHIRQGYRLLNAPGVNTI